MNRTGGGSGGDTGAISQKNSSNKLLCSVTFTITGIDTTITKTGNSVKGPAEALTRIKGPCPQPL